MHKSCLQNVFVFEKMIYFSEGEKTAGVPNDCDRSRSRGGADVTGSQGSEQTRRTITAVWLEFLL